MALRNFTRGLAAPAQVAAYMGHLDVVDLTASASGTAQNGYKAQGDLVIVKTADGSNTAVTLPDPFKNGGTVGDSYTFVNATTQACVIFPPTGGNIAAAGANASVALAANKCVVVYVATVVSGASTFSTLTGA